jgi:D-xylonolactonase
MVRCPPAILSGEPEIIADYACIIGENPLWHPLQKRLYWCDIPSGRLFRYEPATEKPEQCYQGRTIGGFTMQGDDSLLLFIDRGEIAIWREGRPLTVIAQIASERTTRFNDVSADPCGRVFCGTMSSAQSKGSLYRLDLDGSVHKLLGGVGCSNGMAFTLDRKGLYYTDSFARVFSTTTLRTDRSETAVSMRALPKRTGSLMRPHSTQTAGCGPRSGMAPAS